MRVRLVGVGVSTSSARTTWHSADLPSSHRRRCVTSVSCWIPNFRSDLTSAVQGTFLVLHFESNFPYTPVIHSINLYKNHVQETYTSFLSQLWRKFIQVFLINLHRIELRSIRCKKSVEENRAHESMSDVQVSWASRLIQVSSALHYPCTPWRRHHSWRYRARLNWDVQYYKHVTFQLNGCVVTSAISLRFFTSLLWLLLPEPWADVGFLGSSYASLSSDERYFWQMR